MGKLKVIKNRVYTEWKNAFNHNVEQIERAQNENKMSHKATNKRIDNLVLSSGGDSPNEVTDARTDASGTIHDTLKARIDSEETLTSEELKDLNETLTSQREEISQLNGVIRELYSGEGSNVGLYVDADRGNDTTADGTEEKPFKTIQAAVDGIPFLSPSRFYIHVAPGTYREDITVSGLIINGIEIIATNTDVSDAKEKDTGVRFRSITFINCNCYTRVAGITQIDVKNSPGYFIYFVGGSYGSIENCRATTRSKDLDTSKWNEYRTFVWERTNGAIFYCQADYQDEVITAIYNSTPRVNQVGGKANRLNYRSHASIIFVGDADFEDSGDNQLTYAGGKVYD
ncbi:DUF1565 domain-containing protein [Tetragenococcus halophilus]|uniref:DUF1565 domain-containing protein n=1 Tax=Tetragenococcus halophilus TaxID=51669 RepID=UPI0030CA0D63